jgi:hypothetical protein
MLLGSASSTPLVRGTSTASLGDPLVAAGTAVVAAVVTTRSF